MSTGTSTAQVVVNAESGPVTIDVTLHIIERRGSRNGDGWYARIGTAAGIIDVSKLDSESCWLVDGRYSPSGLPFEVHGFGSRCCVKDVLAAEVSAWLDKRIPPVRVVEGDDLEPARCGMCGSSSLHGGMWFNAGYTSECECNDCGTRYDRDGRSR